ncbi:DUF3784 domain-containing protein [Robertkochia flava]|uniref:DUF3784 domain-containing protein n=1 Tax=Robertkochia flava TaxID=3447986 RepID=UPI001CCC8682|nr:DUF3784 domain-containing protein [Robertkochia marina]
MWITALIFIALGIMVKHGRMHQLIAGYNTLSKEEKDKYDIEGIATVFRNVMFGMAFMVFAGYLAGNWLASEKIKMYALILAVIIGLPYLLIRTNSKKFKKDS